MAIKITVEEQWSGIFRPLGYLIFIKSYSLSSSINVIQYRQ
jgi:hypothetical protein